MLAAKLVDFGGRLLVKSKAQIEREGAPVASAEPEAIEALKTLITATRTAKQKTRLNSDEIAEISNWHVWFEDLVTTDPPPCWDLPSGRTRRATAL